MRSLIILEVEHGEDVDGLQRLIDSTVKSSHMYRRHDPSAPVVKDYTVRADIPECFRLES